MAGNESLERLLALVAEGRLTADEAAPILAALEAADAGAPPSASGSAAEERRERAAGAASRTAGDSAATAAPDLGGASALRIEVRDAGRQVVNLRLPLAVGRFALDRVPGLSSEAADRVRDALRTGMRGPVLVVDEGEGDGVRIVLE